MSDGFISDIPATGLVTGFVITTAMPGASPSRVGHSPRYKQLAFAAAHRS